MPEHPACDICGAKPPFRYACSTCPQAVCEDCRTPKWTESGRKWICESTCDTCNEETPNE